MPTPTDPFREDGTCRYSLRQVLNCQNLVLINAEDGHVVLQTRTLPATRVLGPVHLTEIWDAIRDSGHLAAGVRKLMDEGVDHPHEDPLVSPKYHYHTAYLAELTPHNL